MSLRQPKTQKQTKNFVDLYSLMLHRLVAEKMLADEENVLQIARKNLKSKSVLS